MDAPLGSLITAGARLMLALLRHCVSELDGAYVMEDTDSMAIVATENGGLVPFPGGPFKMPDGHSAVRARSWKEVDEIAVRFAKLSPYADKSRSLLKIERDNYDPETGKQRQLFCLAISTKRYVLFLLDENGNPVLLQKGINNHEDRWSELGLGHLRNPMNPDSEDRDWIPQSWISIVRRTLGLPARPLGFEDVPAMGRVPITTPAAIRSLAKLNRGKKYRNRIKPFDFLLTCHVKQFGYPPDIDPEKFHLVAPYVPDPECWVDLPWIVGTPACRLSSAGKLWCVQLCASGSCGNSIFVGLPSCNQHLAIRKKRRGVLESRHGHRACVRVPIGAEVVQIRVGYRRIAGAVVVP